MKQSVFWILGLILISSALHGQNREYAIIEAELETKTGIDRLQVLYDLCNQDINNDQELCRQRGWEMVDSATVYNSRKYIGWGYRFIGLSYHYTSVLDSARYYYNLCVPFFDTPKDQGWSYFNIASIFEFQSQYDSVEHYLNIAESLFRQDTTALVQLGSVINMKGTVAAMKGDKSLALKNYLESKDYMERAGDGPRMADAIRQIGEIYSGQGEHRKAIEAQSQAVQVYRNNNDPYYESLALSDLGNSYHALSMIDSARHYFKMGLEISRKVNHYYVTGTILHRLATINADEGNVAIARRQFKESNDIYGKTNDVYSIVFNMERQSRMEYNLNNHRAVIDLTERGIELAESQDLFKLKSDLLNWQSQSLENTGQHQRALTSFKSYQSIKDSLNSKDRSDKLQELLVEYETEKKEKELIIEQAENDRKSSRNKLLSLGLGALAILSVLVIYIQIMRRRKDQLIHDQEQKIEIEKRKNAEQELVFKKKELVAKTLQLARKNEFLSSLNTEVTALKSVVDVKMKSSTDRISRMITHDANDDDDWEHFAKEFSSIHQGFIDNLSEKHGRFTTNELRLISLMKMNLSSKDIASTLRVSTDGIKKARYRLRKKLNLESSIDLQDYLLSFG